MKASLPLVLGTRNRNKIRELAQILDPGEFELSTLADFPEALEVEETGQTFAENAALKATLQARHLGHWVMAEDSGLSVDALDGAPGVYSARFSGPTATDASNNQLLLDRLAGVAASRRTAHYVCHAVLADPTGTIRASSEGCCHGRIRTEPAGTSGFGYDPLFEVVEYHRTFGELGDAVKSVLSHRSRALARILPQLRALVRCGEWT
jgi:XTP/dITP diphosphohydrolase